jgi:hypothetical protein
MIDILKKANRFVSRLGNFVVDYNRMINYSIIIDWNLLLVNQVEALVEKERCIFKVLGCIISSSNFKHISSFENLLRRKLFFNKVYNKI